MDWKGRETISVKVVDKLIWKKGDFQIISLHMVYAICLCKFGSIKLHNKQKSDTAPLKRIHTII